MKNQTNKITVIVPCWNYGMFLRECLDSILASTVLPHEIIVADDCSSDDSQQIGVEYGLKHRLVKPMRNMERLGTVANENQAAKFVSTPWMFFLDADDKIDPTYIEKVLKVIDERDEKLMVVYSDMQKFGLWDGVWAVSEWDPVALRTGNYINGHSVLRKDLFDRIGGLKDNGNFEDHQMWVDMMDLDKEFYGVHIPEALIWYRRHDFGHRTDKSDITKRQNI